jgi:hypothetical protein
LGNNKEPSISRVEEKKGSHNTKNFSLIRVGMCGWKEAHMLTVHTSEAMGRDSEMGIPLLTIFCELMRII